MTKLFSFPKRHGPKPDTQNHLPHSQLNQHGPERIIDQLHAWCFSLAHVVEEPSGISVPGSQALVLANGGPANPKAFMIGREFAHIHPAPDLGSMHLVLPAEDVPTVIETGWGENHYLVAQGQWPLGLIMVYSPRDEDELEVVKQIVGRSHDFALGRLD